MSSRSLSRLLNLARAWIDTRLRRPVLGAYPLRVHLELNDYCNLACPMCARSAAHVPKNTGNMDIRVVEALRPAFRRALHVGLAGNGEPFLHPRFSDILDIVSREGAVPSVLSNCTLLDAEWARRMTRRRPMILIASIDGGTKEVYEAMRPPAKFETVRENLLNLRREKEKRGAPYPVVQFIVTLCTINEHDLPHLVDLARECGAARISIQNVYPYTESVRDIQIDDPARAEAAVARARQRAAAHGLPVDYYPVARGLSERLKRQGSLGTPAYDGRTTRLYCPNIWTILHVEIGGDVRLCCLSNRAKLGNVLDRPVMELWNHPLMVETRRHMLQGGIPPDCPDCHLLSRWIDARPGRQIRRDLRDLWNQQ